MEKYKNAKDIINSDGFVGENVAEFCLFGRLKFSVNLFDLLLLLLLLMMSSLL